MKYAFDYSSNPVSPCQKELLFILPGGSTLFFRSISKVSNYFNHIDTLFPKRRSESFTTAYVPIKLESDNFLVTIYFNSDRASVTRCLLNPCR